MSRSQVVRRSLLSFAFLALVTAAVAVTAWTAGSVAGAVGSVLELAMFELLFSGFVNWWLLPRAGRLAFHAVALGGVVALVRCPGLPAGAWTDEAGSAIAPAVLLGVFLYASWRPAGPAVSGELLFPLAEGRWVIAQGGRMPLNHHRRVPEQAGALDLLRFGPNGAVATGLGVTAPGGFAAFGTPVLAPCDGEVVEVQDGWPDLDAGQAPHQGPAAGNHVRIRAGAEVIVLAHLRSGSVTVTAGRPVTRGEVIGVVGNSGNTSEPHLHLHAERDGVGLQLRFQGVSGRLARSRRIDAGRR